MTDDLISRQAAIEAINSHFGFNIEEEYGSAVQEVINGLPSAQPDIIRCPDCYYNDGMAYCELHFRNVKAKDFCSWAERITDE